MAVKGASGEGFQIMVSPQTAAIIAFQAQTAAGKLKAVMMPIGPSGCHCSIIRCLGRSLAIVKPWSWRDRPTAKSHMSIISWTSPSPSERILPVSSVISKPRSALCSRRASPIRRTSSPRSGGGTVRQVANASTARSTTRS